MPMINNISAPNHDDPKSTIIWENVPNIVNPITITIPKSINVRAVPNTSDQSIFHAPFMRTCLIKGCVKN